MIAARALLTTAACLAWLTSNPVTADPAGAEITAQGPSGPLAGTLLTAGADAPVVLILPGSGPTDRDGDNPLGVKAAPYRLLAEALAERGVTTARIDKRGLFGSRAAVADPNAVTLSDYAADAHGWAARLRSLTGAPCVWLLGHSEGALIALTAAQDPRDLCGLVLVAGAGRRLSAVLREQLRANPANAPILPQALAAIDALEAGHTVDVAGLDPLVQRLFAPPVQGFLIDMFRRDPVALLRAYAGPVLVLQGTTDLQVAVTDARRLAAARPGVRLVLVDGANHVLKAAPLDRAANLATYADPALPLAPGVAGPIADFVRGR